MGTGAGGGGGELRISFGLASETGRRTRNEDYLGVCLGSPSGRRALGMVAAVADGVGGAKGGRVAAELAVRQFIDGYYAAPATLGVERAAAAAIEAINQWLFQQGRCDPALEGMATTFTALVLRGRRVHLLHVGDSRAYRLNDGRLTRLSEDHTLKRPELTHVLYRAVALEASVRLDHAAHPLEPHDRLLLCTDGVHGALDDQRIAARLMRHAAPDETARQLVADALEAGSADNASALVIDILGLPAPDQGELEEELARLPILTPPAGPGEVIDGVRLEAVLARGRHAVVFRGLDLTNGQAVVMKFPRGEEAGEEGGERSQRLAFLREAWVTARVRSPFLGQAIVWPPGRQTRLYSVMPYYAGETLEARLHRKPTLTLAEGITIAVALCRAVSALHRAGIIHRDIKPDNVILEDGGSARLIDLGVVRLPRLEEFPAADIPGTPSYMAPELFAGQAGDELSDQYALGVTLYRAFSGNWPFGEVEPFQRPRFSKRASLSSQRPDLPAWLDATLARATATQRKERFPDVLEFAADLENGLAGAAITVRRRVPLYQRNPLLFWQVTAALLALALIYVSHARV